MKDSILKIIALIMMVLPLLLCAYITNQRNPDISFAQAFIVLSGGLLITAGYLYLFLYFVHKHEPSDG